MITWAVHPEAINVWRDGVLVAEIPHSDWPLSNSSLPLRAQVQGGEKHNIGAMCAGAEHLSLAWGRRENY